jgi:sporulation protein YlmC with PRC-barrel domain
MAQEKPAAKADDQAQVAIAHTFTASQIIGMPVRNRTGKDLGKIDDLVIDFKTGEIRYAALSFGGFLGLGTKLFAIPWNEMKFVFGDPNNKNDRHFLYEVTQQQLENAPGFDSSKWPNVADPKFAAEIDKHYNVRRPSNAPVQYETVFRASKMKGIKARDNKNNEFGSLDEIVIDITAGKAMYFVLTPASGYNLDNKLVVAPLSACTLTHAQDQTFLVLALNKEGFQGAPNFEKDRWPNMADRKWRTDVDQYYERTAQKPAARP